MIKFELFSLKCLGSNINWKDKKINIKDNIKYIFTNLEHYQFTNTNIKTDDIDIDIDIDNDSEELELPLPFTYSDITKYWLKNIAKYNETFKIDFNNLILDTDYAIAALYVSKNQK